MCRWLGHSASEGGRNKSVGDSILPDLSCSQWCLVEIKHTMPTEICSNFKSLIKINVIDFKAFNFGLVCYLASQVAQWVKNPPTMQEMKQTWIRSLGWEDPLEEGRATHPSTLSWRIPWTEEPGGLRSMGSQRVSHSWSDLAHMLHSNI